MYLHGTKLASHIPTSLPVFLGQAPDHGPDQNKAVTEELHSNNKDRLRQA